MDVRQIITERSCTAHTEKAQDTEADIKANSPMDRTEVELYSQEPGGGRGHTLARPGSPVGWSPAPSVPTPHLCPA